eukprot:8612301-Karenia_brevis.AAC.1
MMSLCECDGSPVSDASLHPPMHFLMQSLHSTGKDQPAQSSAPVNLEIPDANTLVRMAEPEASRVIAAPGAKPRVQKKPAAASSDAIMGMPERSSEPMAPRGA